MKWISRVYIMEIEDEHYSRTKRECFPRSCTFLFTPTNARMNIAHLNTLWMRRLPMVLNVYTVKRGQACPCSIFEECWSDLWMFWCVTSSVWYHRVDKKIYVEKVLTKKKEKKHSRLNLMFHADFEVLYDFLKLHV